MYEMTNFVSFTDCDRDGRLKLHRAVGFMMDCCQFQEYQEKAFCDFLRENKLAIFLFSIQIDVRRMPEFREKITTAVKIYGCKSIYGLRRLTIKDEKGDICLLVNATGAFFDTQAGKAAKLDTTDIPLKFDVPEEMECLPRKVFIPSDGGTCVSETVVTRSKLDPNGHLTSAEYFAIALDALPCDFTFNRVRIEYKKQAKPTEKVFAVLHRLDGNKIVVDMRGGDEMTFAAAEFSTAEV